MCNNSRPNVGHNHTNNKVYEELIECKENAAVTQRIKVTQNTLNVNINIPVQMHQCKSCQTTFTHRVTQPCFQSFSVLKERSALATDTVMVAKIVSAV